MRETQKVLIIIERADWLTLKAAAEAEQVPAAILLGRLTEAWVRKTHPSLRASLTAALDAAPGKQLTVDDAIATKPTSRGRSTPKKETSGTRRTRK
jgi:predicted DNA-binding ribbon-helix-helix protein